MARSLSGWEGNAARAAGESGPELSLGQMDHLLLKALQTDFPLVERPFAVLGEALGLSEEDVLARVRRLKEAGLIREISAIFDSQRLGYQSLLVALAVPPERLDRVGGMVSGQPGVSHNYARDHRYNLWFTLTLPPGEDPAQRGKEIAEAAEAAGLLLLPAQRRFKIGVSFDLCSEQSVVADASYPGSQGQGVPPDQVMLTDRERGLVRALQRDLVLEPRPFLLPAQSLGLTDSELLEEARRLQARGVMRRFGAVLRHRVAGVLGNGMSCWVVPAERAEPVGRAMAEWPGVTHCYERTTAPDWPYNLFAMLHARTRADCLKSAAALSARVGIADYVVLFSEREFKKERVRYFEPDAATRAKQSA